MSRLLQVIIAIVGLALTYVVQVASNQNDEAQTRQGYLMLYSQAVSSAISSCDAGLLFLAQDAAKELDGREHATRFADNLDLINGTIQGPACQHATAVAAAATPAPATAATENAPTVTPNDAFAAQSGRRWARAAVAPILASQSQNLAFRREETARIAPNAAPAPGDHYYAVLASYGVGDANTFDPALGVVAQYTQLATATHAANVELRVFRTRISNHFAIVLGPANGLTQDQARDLVVQARREGWASDAFVQQANDWTPCPTPGTIEGMRACAG